MLVTQRSEFASVIEREGMEGFLARLEKLAGERAPGASAHAWDNTH